MIKLTRAEVEEACRYWLRAVPRNSEGTDRETSINTPVAISKEKIVSCRFRRGGVECTVISKQPK